jgi:hypothetical protein
MKAANRFFQLFINTRLATLLCFSLLISCGDSITTAGIGGTGISYGAVSGFGSIILNGSHLDDSTASVTLDDNPPVSGSINHGGLKEGMVVKVSGDFSGNTGTAESIEYRDSLEGEVCDLVTPIDTSIPITGIITLRVLGQTVILDATTFVDNSTKSINAGDILEVSGLPDKDGKIHASFVEVKNPAPTEVEVKGLVVGVSGFTLTINQLAVDFSSALIDDSIPNNTPAAGQFVEVKGLAIDFACGGVNDTLSATKVELEPEGAGDISNSDHAEVEGLVTVAFVELNPPGGPGTFKIGNRQIQTTNSTRFLPEGFDSSDLLILGTKVEAEGTSANGVLTATKISFRENVKLESDVATGDANSFTLVGLPNIIITTNSTTIIEPGVTFISGVSHIRVRGIEGPIEGINNTVLATRIEDRGTSTSAFLQGSTDQVANPSITILGLSLDTSGFTDTPLLSSDFENVNDQKISRSTFFALVQPGTLVKFKGDLVGSTIIWDEAELEDD